MPALVPVLPRGPFCVGRVPRSAMIFQIFHRCRRGRARRLAAGRLQQVGDSAESRLECFPVRALRVGARRHLLSHGADGLFDESLERSVGSEGVDQDTLEKGGARVRRGRLDARDPVQRRGLSLKGVGNVGSALPLVKQYEGGRGGGAAVYTVQVVFRLEEAVLCALLGIRKCTLKRDLVGLCVGGLRRAVSTQ